MPFKKDPGQEDLIYGVPTDGMNVSQILIDSENQVIQVVYFDGQLDQDDNFTKIGKGGMYVIQGQDFIDLINKNPNGNKNFYDNIKEEVYGKLAAGRGKSGVIV